MSEMELQKRMADNSLEKAENMNEDKFSWKAQKDFWEKKQAQKKAEKAQVVVNAAQLEQKDMEEQFGKGSPQEMKARMKVSAAEVAMAEIKAAYRAYGDEAKDPQELAKVSKADAAKVAKSPIEEMGKAAKEAADKVTDEKSMKELDNFK